MDKLERKLERARSGESSGRASNALATFELTRPIVGASALGIAQAAYEWTLGYLANGSLGAHPLEAALDESSTAGRPPLERQGNQQVLAQVATEIEAARLLVQRAAWMGRNGIPLTGGQGSMSKLKAGQVAVWATRTLMDLVGPYAYTAECPLEKWFRDAKIYELFEGTAEIQRLVISRMQVAEYSERLLEAAAIAAEATEPQVGGSVAATP
jgi:alkylation response protein AidB-like acyl-CoA dehydrogenase